MIANRAAADIEETAQLIKCLMGFAVDLRGRGDLAGHLLDVVCGRAEADEDVGHVVSRDGDLGPPVVAQNGRDCLGEALEIRRTVSQQVRELPGARLVGGADVGEAARRNLVLVVQQFSFGRRGSGRSPGRGLSRG